MTRRVLDARLSRTSRIVVAITAVIVGIGALYGGGSLLADPAALGADEAWLDGSPFPDFTIPGVVLLVVIGGGMLATATLAITGAHRAAAASVAMGVVLLTWGIVETVVIGYQGGQQFILVGAFVLAPAAILLWVGLRASSAVSPGRGSRRTSSDASLGC